MIYVKANTCFLQSDDSFTEESTTGVFVQGYSRRKTNCTVYIRYCGSLESAQVHIKRVKSFTPEKGHVSVLSITDKQYSNIIHIWGAIEKKTRPTPLQLDFF